MLAANKQLPELKDGKSGPTFIPGASTKLFGMLALNF